MKGITFNDFRTHFSPARIDRYRSAAGGNDENAMALYTANMAVAGAFHPLLSTLEVVLRNRLDTVLSGYFGDPCWILNQRWGFMSHPSLTRYVGGKPVVNDFLKKEVDKAVLRLRQRRVPVTNASVLADQSLGFWTELFEPHIFKLLGGCPIEIFGNLPFRKRLYEISGKLSKIRQMRNRINHNEPICFSGNMVDFSEAWSVYGALRNVLDWMDPKLLDYISGFDMVVQTICHAENLGFGHKNETLPIALSVHFASHTAAPGGFGVVSGQ